MNESISDEEVLEKENYASNDTFYTTSDSDDENLNKEIQYDDRGKIKEKTTKKIKIQAQTYRNKMINIGREQVCVE